MTDLKTLKDMTQEMEYLNKDGSKTNSITDAVDSEELKAEAVKCIKSIIRQCSNYKNCEICKQKVEWIKWFFNITSEDLA